MEYELMRLETVKARQDNPTNSNEPVVAYKDDVYIRDKGFVTGPTVASGTPTAEGDYVPGKKMQAVRNVQKMDDIKETDLRLSGEGDSNEINRESSKEKVLQERVSSETTEDKTTSKPKSPQDSKSKKIQK